MADEVMRCEVAHMDSDTYPCGRARQSDREPMVCVECLKERCRRLEKVAEEAADVVGIKSKRRQTVAAKAALIAALRDLDEPGEKNDAE